MTTISGAKAAALGIAALRRHGYHPKTLQEYHVMHLARPAEYRIPP
jgi:hypothetical protein